ncbi:unnamed protein product, partial [Symbiodinium necroappetens]
AFRKDVFYENLAWKEGNGSAVLLDGEGKKLPKHASLRLVVPDLVRTALAKLPVVEEQPAMRRAVEPAPATPPGLTEPQLGEAKKDDLWEVVEDAGSTTAPSAEAEVPEPESEPTASQDRAQDLLSSGKEVWAATVSERTVLFEYVRNASGGRKQPDIVAKLINLQDADTVAAWSQNRALPKILVREEEGQIWVSSEFLQARCKKLSLEESPRSDGQRERSRSPRRCKHAAEEEQAPAERRSRPLGRGLQVRRPAKDDKAEDAKPADDKPAEAAPAAQPAEDVEMADAQPAEEAEDDKPAELRDMSVQEPADAEQAEDVEPAEEAEDDKPAELQDMPAQEPADAVMEPAPAEPSDSSDSQGDAAGPVQGLRTTDKGDGWHELMARTLEEYTADLEIIKRRWTQEIYHINTQQKLALKIAKRSVLPRDALVQVHVA